VRVTTASARARGRLAAVVAVALIVTACAGGASPSPTAAPTSGPTAAPSGKIVVSNWDLYFPEDLIANFTAETGIEVEWSKHATNEEIIGKLDASNGAGFDVVFVSAPFAEGLNNRGWAHKLDHGQLPNLSNLAPEADQLGYDPGNTFSVPYTWGTTGLCYRSDLLDFEPSSWNDLLKPRAELKGKVTMLATDRWLLMPALIVLGYSVNETDPAKLNEARDLLLETKKDLLAYDDTTFYSKLVSAEAHLVQAWDGWCNYGIAENEDIKFVVPSEGSDLWSDTMVVLESSQNKAAAYAFIDYILRPEVGKSVVDLTLYKVPSPAAMALVDQETMDAFPNLAMTPAELLKGEPERDLGAAAPAWARVVAEILAGQ
jgi:spermidine/putrescine transport system substrate-binding protein